MHSKRMADLNWWCTQLAGAPLEPLLTTDYPRSGRPNIGQNQGDIVRVSTTPLLLSHEQAGEVNRSCMLAPLFPRSYTEICQISSQYMIGKQGQEGKEILE